MSGGPGPALTPARGSRRLKSNSGAGQAIGSANPSLRGFQGQRAAEDAEQGLRTDADEGLRDEGDRRGWDDGKARAESWSE